MLEAFGGAATFMVSAGHSLDLPGSCQPSQCLDHRLARCAQSPCNGCRPEPKLMKMKGFRGHALIAWGSRGVRQNSRKRKFGFGSNSLRSGPPTNSRPPNHLRCFFSCTILVQFRDNRYNWSTGKSRKKESVAYSRSFVETHFCFLVQV
jgi:hypothetical protein